MHKSINVQLSKINNLRDILYFTKICQISLLIFL